MSVLQESILVRIVLERENSVGITEFKREDSSER